MSLLERLVDWFFMLTAMLAMVYVFLEMAYVRYRTMIREERKKDLMATTKVTETLEVKKAAR